MNSRVAILVEPNGSVRVLTNSADVQVLVLDRDVAGKEGHIDVEGAPAAADSLVEGIPRVDPQRVELLFGEVERQLGAAAAVPGIGPRGRAQLVNLRRSWFPPA